MPTLDLGDLPLLSIPHEISDLTELKWLAVGIEKLAQRPDGSYEFERDKTRGRSQLHDASAIKTLPQLEGLSLIGCGKVDVSFLRELRNLQHLDLTGQRAFDLQMLASHESLKSLNLDGVEINDYGPLSRFEALRHLQISNTDEFRSTDVLRDLKNLEWLNLWACWELTDIAALSELPNLKGLVLDQCHNLIQTSAVSKCVSLERLSFVWCMRTLEALPDLSSLSHLAELSCSGCPGLKDIAPLADATSLTRLDLGNFRGNLSPLRALKELKHLCLNRKPRLDELAELSNLVTLNLGNGHADDFLQDLSFLRRLPRLKALDVSWGQQIADWSPIKGLTELEVLNARSSSFRDLSLLEPLTKLRELNLEGCGALPSVSSRVGPMARISEFIRSCLKQRKPDPKELMATEGSLALLNRLSKFKIGDHYWRRGDSEDDVATVDTVFHWE